MGRSSGALLVIYDGETMVTKPGDRVRGVYTWT
jgi:hypothetical protein